MEDERRLRALSNQLQSQPKICRYYLDIGDRAGTGTGPTEDRRRTDEETFWSETDKMNQ